MICAGAWDDERHKDLFDVKYVAKGFKKLYPVTQAAWTDTDGNHWIGINGITMIHCKGTPDPQRVHEASVLFPRYRQ